MMYDGLKLLESQKIVNFCESAVQQTDKQWIGVDEDLLKAADDYQQWLIRGQT